MTIGTPTRLTPDFYVCDINGGPQCVGCAYGATAEEATARAAQFAATTLLDELAEWFTEFRDELIADHYGDDAIDEFIAELAPFGDQEV